MKKEITIKKVYINTSSKAGVPFKDGSTMVSIMFDMDGEKEKASGFFHDGDPELGIEEGQKVTVELERKGAYLNFTLYGAIGQTAKKPAVGTKATDFGDVMKRIGAIEKRVMDLEKARKSEDELSFE